MEIENKLHTEPEEPPGNLLALALLAPVVGAAAGFLGAAFRLALEYTNLWRNIRNWAVSAIIHLLR